MPGGGRSSSSTSDGGGSSTDAQRPDPVGQLKVRHRARQQRLQILCHASKCIFEEGKCPVTPHCAAMKKLWQHIVVCKEPECNVQHCLSSRYVLSHYRKCKDPQCPMCEPVRQTIRISHDKIPAKLKSKCLELLKGLQSHQHGWVFNCPVVPAELGLPDYLFYGIKLGTIQKRLESGLYHSISEFSSDVNLAFESAMMYNQEGTIGHNMAKEMKEKFAADYEKLEE